MEKSLETAQLIREERIKQGISIRGLAKLAGCTARSICYWESGEREITLNIADRILKVLGVSVNIGDNHGKR